MRRFISGLTVLTLLSFLLACGGGGTKTTPVTPTSTSFAFLSSTSTPYEFNPVIGKLTGSSFTSSIVKDPSTGEAVQAEMYSIMMSPDEKSGVVDLSSSAGWAIYVGNVQTAALTQLTNGPNDMNPAYSADGKKVVFNSTNQQEVRTVSIINIDGTNRIDLPLPEGAYTSWAPTFSPDGTKITVEAWGNTFDGIFVMNTDGSNPVMLTNPYATCDCYDENPMFTADGTKIVYSRDDWTTSTETEDIFIMNSDGTGVTKLTDSKGINFDPMVKGNKIFFSSNRDNLTAGPNGFELYVMNLDGTGLTRLTNNTTVNLRCTQAAPLNVDASSRSHPAAAACFLGDYAGTKRACFTFS
jgi:Tol biopolymer transport system component